MHKAISASEARGSRSLSRRRRGRGTSRHCWLPSPFSEGLHHPADIGRGDRAAGAIRSQYRSNLSIQAGKCFLTLLNGDGVCSRCSPVMVK